MERQALTFSRTSENGLSNHGSAEYVLQAQMRFSLDLDARVHSDQRPRSSLDAHTLGNSELQKTIRVSMINPEQYSIVVARDVLCLSHRDSVDRLEVREMVGMEGI